MAPPQIMGMYPADSVSEVHSALPLDPLGNGTPELLAADVEYRLHLIAQEARKFMVAAKRRTLRPEDVEMAMEAMNVEPVLVPPAPLSSFSTRSPFVPLPTGPSSNPLNPTAPSALSSSSHPIYYHTPDEEIDFSTFLRQPLPPATRGPGGVRWKAHWLAVEGVQPAIPENPAPSSVAKEGDKGRPTATEVNGAAAMSTGSGAGGKSSHPTTGQASLRASARQTLPQELQLYFSNLTSSLAPDVSSFGAASGSGSSAGTASVGGASAAAAIPEDLERHRQAALASLRSDPALAGVLVYLVRWLNESITKSLAGELQVLGWLLDGVGAVLDNGEVFLEPYLHTLLPPLLSVLLTVPLGPDPPAASSAGRASQVTAYDLRLRSSDLLASLLAQYSPRYPGLRPRLLRVFEDSLYSDPFPSPLGPTRAPAGRYEGALLGIAAVGTQGVRKVLFSPGSDLEHSDTGLGRGMDRVEALFPILYPSAARETGGPSGGRGAKASDREKEREREKERPGLVRALQRCFGRIIRAHPQGSAGEREGEVDHKALRGVVGEVGVRAVGRRGWMAAEVRRVVGEWKAEEGGMDVET